MNRFERLFFILEKYDNSLSQGGAEPGGVIKVTVTADKIRIAAEVNNLRPGNEHLYELALFFKNKHGEFLPPRFIDVKCGQTGILRDNIAIVYDGQTVFGAGLSYRNSNNLKNKHFPLVSFKVKQDEWRRYLNDLVISENNKLREAEEGREAVRKEQEPVRNKEVQTQRNERRPETQNRAADSKPNEVNKTDVLSNTPAQPVHDAKRADPDKKYDFLIVNKEEMLCKNFSAFDPFDTTNKSYKWWKGSDMHQINRVLIETGIKLPFELNKEGYLACEIFGHVLLGMYNDKVLEREFFILGIPAKEKSGAGNYYSNSRWEESAFTQGAGENGYWLTYIDCETSRVVKVI